MNLSADPNTREKRFDWPVCHDAEQFIAEQLDALCACNSFAALLAQRLRTETGTLLMDWVDHLVLPASTERALGSAGYSEDPIATPPGPSQKALRHREATLPPIILEYGNNRPNTATTIAIHVESLSDFAAAHDLPLRIEGEEFTRFRRALLSNENNTRFEVVERRGYAGYEPEPADPRRLAAALQAQDLWNNRRRSFDDDACVVAQTHAVLDRVIALAGRDLACHIVFASERAYWQQRNRAAQIQKARQDRLGLGWANHDHHTFRSSRSNFLELIRAFEKLGLQRRERYYAGAQAGWGAQILEHSVEGIVTFCDVDLEPEETQIDFSREGLPPARRLGTIGLWVGLHGESLLEAGMHHLECRFDFSLLRDQLAAAGVGMMKPFSDFSFLKQAFTDGERWPVHPQRAQRLFRAGLITEHQLQQFINEGAIGSHLENLQRKGGFKGFNQQSVSAIIQETDPRKGTAEAST